MSHVQPILHLVRRLLDGQSEALELCQDCGAMLNASAMAIHDCPLDPRHDHIVRRVVEIEGQSRAHARARGYAVR